MSKNKLKIFFVEIGLFFMQMIFSKVIFFEIISPVGFSFAITRLFAGGNIFAVTIEYIVSKIYLFDSFNQIVMVVFEVIILSLYYFSREYIKTNKNRRLILIFVAISSSVGLYFSFSSLNNLVFYLIHFIFQLIITLYFYQLYKAFKNKFLFFKFSHLDYFLFSFLIFLISIGLFSFKFINNYIGFVILTMIIIIANKIMETEKFFLLTNMLALGAFFANFNTFYLIFAVFSSVFLVNIKNLNKYVYAIICFLFFVLMAFLFKIYGLVTILLLTSIIITYMLVPNEFIIKISGCLELDSYNMLSICLQDRKLEKIKNKMQIMSKTMQKMKNNFKGLLVGKIDRLSASVELSNDVISRCCKICENYKFCFMQNINKKSLIENELYNRIQNPKGDEYHLNNGLSCYCKKSGILSSEINQIAELYLEYEKSIKTEDESKLIIADELDNFSEIFNSYSKLLNDNSKINYVLSRQIKEALLNLMIDIKEVFILENCKGVESVNIIATNENILKTEVCDVISKIVKNKMITKEINHLEYSGLSVAKFIPKSKIGAHFAVSTKAKENLNGDNVVISKLDDNKYFIALADGMGHGKNANKTSNMVLDLIKSMFEAGLDCDLVINSVNKLLLPVGLDNFTTLDVCVLDLELEECYFIKLGSSVSVLKHKNTSEIIVSESLPIGIIKNIKSTIIKKKIYAGDIIFIASDGVVDSFNNVEEYKNVINDAQIYNLQKYIDNLLSDAEYQSKHLDDMSIIGINLLKN